MFIVFLIIKETKKSVYKFTKNIEKREEKNHLQMHHIFSSSPFYKPIFIYIFKNWYQTLYSVWYPVLLT